MKQIILITSFFLVFAIVLVIKLPGWLATHERHQKDGQILTQSSKLQHIAQALSNPKIQTVEDLYEHIDEVKFQSAPDPSELLKQMNAHNPPASKDAVPLKVMSYNVALLDVELLGFIDYKRTPYLNERRATLPSIILDRDDDIVFLQEVWRDEDVERFSTQAKAHGYRVFVSSRFFYNDGIMTLVKSSRINSKKRIRFEAHPYDAQDTDEFFPGPQIMRGFHVVDLDLIGIGPIHLYNTHMLAWPQQWCIRMQQARELGLHAKHRSHRKHDLVLVAGDMNSGPYYANDSWTINDGTVQHDWWKNALAYPLLLHYGDLIDLVVMGRATQEATSDVTLGRLAKHASTEWCTQIGRTTFTASDCNALYSKQYNGTEYPARIDQLLAFDSAGRIHVVKSELVFTEQVAFGAKLVIEPSDHYGIFVDLRVRPHL